MISSSLSLPNKSSVGAEVWFLKEVDEEEEEDEEEDGRDEEEAAAAAAPLADDAVAEDDVRVEANSGEVESRR